MLVPRAGRRGHALRPLYDCAQRWCPVGKVEGAGQRVHDLENEPAAHQVDPEHLPEGTTVDLVDQLPESGHGLLHRGGRAIEARLALEFDEPWLGM